MSRSPSDMNNDCDIEELRIIFDNIPDLENEDIVISNFINWQPPYDLYVVGDEVVVTIEIAGVTVKDFSIYAGKRYMVIEGIRKSPEILTKECCTFHNIEIPYGRFNRRIDFPAAVEAKNCRHTINNGLLRLRFPLIREKVIPIEEE